MYHDAILGYTFDQFLLGAVTARVLNRTSARLDRRTRGKSVVQEFAIRNICARSILGP